MATTHPELAVELAGVATTALLGAGLSALPAVLYHGPIPDEAECEDGRVAVWFDTATGTERFPSPSAVVGCGGPPMLDYRVRWTRCWPIEPNYVPDMSTLAADLLTGAMIVHDAYTALTCAADSGVEGVAVKGLALMSTRSRAPMGGVAGVEWRLLVRPSFRPVPPEEEPE